MPVNEKLKALLDLGIDKVHNTPLELNPAFAPTQMGIVDLIEKYWVSRYKDGDSDDAGFKKAFYNVVRKPTFIDAKMTDLDTKDIRLLPVDGQSPYPAIIFENDLKFWMKDKGFGKLLNDIVYNWPKYGTVVLKKVRDEIFLVPIKNFGVDPEVDKLKDSDFIFEKHEYSIDKFKEMPWDEPAMIEAIDTAKEDKITVYEFYGECDCMEGHNYHILTKEGIILHHDYIEDIYDRYRELHWDKIAGRWLGRGRVEDLFEAQISENINENLFKQGLRWTAKHIFQTRDDTVAENLLSDIENGKLMIVNSEITPVATEERNLAAYNFASNKWMQNIADLSFGVETLAGQRPPAGTPLGTSILQTQQAGMFYQMKQEELGMFIKDILFDWIIPTFQKQNIKQHAVLMGNFTDNALDKIREAMVAQRTNERVLQMISAGNMPTGSEMQVLQGIITEQVKKEKKIEVPEGFYKDLKYKIDIIITGEQIDLNQKVVTLQTVMQILGSNPTILQDKRIKKVFLKMVEALGLDISDFETDDSSDLMSIMQNQMAQRGGSVASPMPMGNPQMIQTSKVL